MPSLNYLMCLDVFLLLLHTAQIGLPMFDIAPVPAAYARSTSNEKGACQRNLHTHCKDLKYLL